MSFSNPCRPSEAGETPEPLWSFARFPFVPRAAVDVRRERQVLNTLTEQQHRLLWLAVNPREVRHTTMGNESSTLNKNVAKRVQHGRATGVLQLQDLRLKQVRATAICCSANPTPNYPWRGSCPKASRALKPNFAPGAQVPDSLMGVGGKLRSLSLQNNLISTLPSFIGSFSTLKTLVLDSNHVTVLPPEMERLTKLETLSVRNVGLAALACLAGLLQAKDCLSQRPTESRAAAFETCSNL